MRKIFILFLALSTPAIACKLPLKTKLVIGCTYKCGIDYKLRLNLSAWALGHKIEIVDLRDLGPLEVALTKVDAVVMPGGADINPDYYSDSVTRELREYLQANRGLANVNAESHLRDPFEYSFIRTYLGNEKNSELPLLGICRGMQMMTVGQGVPLYLDIKTELGIKNRRYLFDRIHLEKNSLLDDIYRNDTFKGFKLHHQGLRVPYYLENESDYPNMKVTAWSNDGRIAEGIEYLNRPALGVQYHPEKSLTSTAAPVFRWLLTRACEYKTAKVVP